MGWNPRAVQTAEARVAGQRKNDVDMPDHTIDPAVEGEYHGWVSPTAGIFRVGGPTP